MASRASSARSSRSSKPRPAHHANNSATLFRNPWPSAEKPTWSELLTISNPLSWYNNHDLHKDERAREIKVVQPDWGISSPKNRGLKQENCIVGTWLGHAGVMVELPLEGVRNASMSRASTGSWPSLPTQRKPSLWVLFDPIFSMRAGPTQYTGPSRMKPSPVQAADLPACDAVVISHNHYDHLDLVSIKAILLRFPKCKFFVPLGNKTWLTATGVPSEQINEMDWWSDLEFSPRDFGFEVEENDMDSTVLKFTCVPAQHNSGRGTLDQGSTLWSGWVIEQFLHPKIEESDKLVVRRTRKGGIYHAGDTGYRRTAKSEEVCPIFEEIGKKLGPFDLSFIPIWRGGTLSFISYIGLRLSHQEIPSAFHASPADAIDIHKVVKSKNTVGVHFGTFIGSVNESYEATIEFDEAREKQGVAKLEDSSQAEHGRAGLIDIGESIAIEIETR
ncbi:Metallo-hydrolase/oxidoreductase [Mollisia scopiformis]|uniref:Metallo-hydrolase/oxidoreductase n=1 Tax=Mollisia scopiformis TaxID=149040 RepID=A0A194WZD1_MOLSC|nr:Metallo-hydrolase/oxidoreductase [Mollisia scopiformis]KUJ12962.1 Metallo-hydrolase/oxidoreductase [Mollisia scopiformis]